MRELIARYLEAPEERRAATLAEMGRRCEEALEEILSFRGPYPADVHPVDVFPDYLAPLLTSLLVDHPEILIGRNLTKLSAGQRWVLLSAAIESEDPRFNDAVLEGLEDRSSAVKLLVVEAVSRLGHLRHPLLRERLQRLMSLESMVPHRKDIQLALQAVMRDS